MYDIIGEDKLRGQLKELQGGEGPCKKSWKSLERLSRTYRAGTVLQTFWLYAPLKWRIVLYTPGHKSRTQPDFDLRFSR